MEDTYIEQFKEELLKAPETALQDESVIKIGLQCDLIKEFPEKKCYICYKQDNSCDTLKLCERHMKEQMIIKLEKYLHQEKDYTTLLILHKRYPDFYKTNLEKVRDQMMNETDTRHQHRYSALMNK